MFSDTFVVLATMTATHLSLLVDPEREISRLAVAVSLSGVVIEHAVLRSVG